MFKVESLEDLEAVAELMERYGLAEFDDGDCYLSRHCCLPEPADEEFYEECEDEECEDEDEDY